MSQPTVLSERQGRVGVLTLNRPEQLNAFTVEMAHELIDAFEQASQDDDVAAIVVTGADKQKVGQFAADVRASRKPEPYKGKGVRYEGEVVRRKAGKAGK